ncbi:hypothetical protein GCM10027569_76380 [Flindersiella endophytica]
MSSTDPEPLPATPDAPRTEMVTSDGNTDAATFDTSHAATVCDEPDVAGDEEPESTIEPISPPAVPASNARSTAPITR